MIKMGQGILQEITRFIPLDINPKTGLVTSAGKKNICNTTSQLREQTSTKDNKDCKA